MGTANLLVVFLLVELYKLVRGESRTILSGTGTPNSRPSSKEWLQPGRHDLPRLFGAALAANRGRSSNHSSDSLSHLPDLQDHHGAPRARPWSVAPLGRTGAARPSPLSAR